MLEDTCYLDKKSKKVRPFQSKARQKSHNRRRKVKYPLKSTFHPKRKTYLFGNGIGKVTKNSFLVFLFSEAMSDLVVSSRL